MSERGRQARLPSQENLRSKDHGNVAQGTTKSKTASLKGLPPRPPKSSRTEVDDQSDDRNETETQSETSSIGADSIAASVQSISTFVQSIAQSVQSRNGSSRSGSCKSSRNSPATAESPDASILTRDDLSWSSGSLSFLRKRKDDREETKTADDKYAMAMSGKGKHNYPSSTERATSQSHEAPPASDLKKQILESVGITRQKSRSHSSRANTRETSNLSTVSVSSQKSRKSVRIGHLLPKNPTLEYLEAKSQWVIANQNGTSGSKHMLTIHVFDQNQQVYISKCKDVSIHIQGRRVNNVVIDYCSRVDVVFGSALGSCEVANSKKIKIQTTGVCPTFTFEKTDHINVWLSRESTKISSFVTRKCTHVHLSVPRDTDENDRKEVALPDQFVHKLFDAGTLSSQPNFR